MVMWQTSSERSLKQALLVGGVLHGHRLLFLDKFYRRHGVLKLVKVLFYGRNGVPNLVEVFNDA